MDLLSASPKRDLRGFTLSQLAAVFMTMGLMALGGVLAWTSSNARQTARSNQYFRTAAAAEAATEKVLAKMIDDFKYDGARTVSNNMSVYPTRAPTSAENSYWSNYEFKDTNRVVNKVSVYQTYADVYTNMNTKYSGLKGYATGIEMVSTARELNSSMNIPVTVKQTVQLATIPIFQFAIFYGMDLEIEPGRNMDVTGRVHGNANLYTYPDGVTLTFWSDVTAVGYITNIWKPGDPRTANPGTVIYKGHHDAYHQSLTLPIGTNNTPDAVYEILKIPPAGEGPPMSDLRYYNAADLILVVSNATNVATLVKRTSAATNLINIPWNSVTSFVSVATSNVFYNKREADQVRVTDLNIGRFNAWTSSSNVVTTNLGANQIQCIYYTDERTWTTNQPGLRVMNGRYLTNDLSIAARCPLYIKGNFNAPALQSTNTSTAGTRATSLVGDAITILSDNWIDSTNTTTTTPAGSDTTVNAAFIAGSTETYVGGNYGGGVENFPRFLQDWTSATFFYNGSMVSLFYSKIADSRWKTGVTYYSPPTRKWQFDLNFMDPTKLPPRTPKVTHFVRETWAIIKNPS